MLAHWINCWLPTNQALLPQFFGAIFIARRRNKCLQLDPVATSVCELCHGNQKMRSVNFLFVYLFENISVLFYSVRIYDNVCKYNTPQITLKFRSIIKEGVINKIHVFVGLQCSHIGRAKYFIVRPLLLNQFQEYNPVGLHYNSDQIYA